MFLVRAVAWLLVALDHARFAVASRLEILGMAPQAMQWLRKVFDQRAKDLLERLQVFRGDGHEGIRDRFGERVPHGLLENPSQ